MKNFMRKYAVAVLALALLASASIAGSINQPGGAGDITDVFGCASGDCANIATGATDLLDMSGTDASTATEGLILPQHATACAGGTAEGQVCWEADANILHVGDAAALQNFPPASAYSGDATVSATGVVAIQADSVALTTDTTGNYAAGDAEAGAATSVATGVVAVTDIANGTDGELITWSATGVAETVAVGTATHVLTSNGVGLAPTFQAAAGGGSPTQEFYQHVQAVSGGASLTFNGYRQICRAGAAAHVCYTGFYVPSDFTAITEAVFIVLPNTNQAAADWDTHCEYGAVGENLSNGGTQTSTDTTTTYNVLNDNLFDVDISGRLASLTAGDYVSCSLTESTAGHNVDVLGIRFKY